MAVAVGLVGYHSKFNDTTAENVCGCPLLPLNTSKPGRAAPVAVPDDKGENKDIIDEALYTYRANTLLQAYAVTGPADRLLMWLTLYIHQCLVRIRGKPRAEAEKVLYNLARESFPAPGETSFILGGFFPSPKSPAEKERWTTYVKQLREDLYPKLLDKVYAHPTDSGPDKFWVQFTLHPFMGLFFERPDTTGRLR
eukprot:TRINITY_DN67808_c0_g1_i1.p1 TRINITY_DN67808_c0_g1~~TRINITY_DN67808_c0_g1_i1.p1  ORF type:complete len:196 (+),score=26.50 TRINITY_DN67808_c0_g1_i1:121-708(+)